MYHEYREYLQSGQPCQISLLSDAPMSMIEMHTLLHKSASHILKSGLMFLAAFPHSGDSLENMTLLADKAEEILTFPGQQKMGSGSWQPQSVEKHSMTLLDTESYGEAIKMALRSLADQWNLPQSCPTDELSFSLALMNTLPSDHPGAVTYEDKMNILSHPGNMTALKSDHRTSISCGEQPRVSLVCKALSIKIPLGRIVDNV